MVENIKTTLDNNILKELRDVINTEPLLSFLTNKKIHRKKININHNVLFNFLYSFLYRIEEIVKEINDLKSINKRSELVNLVNNVFILNEGLEQLESNIRKCTNSSEFKLNYDEESVFFESLEYFWLHKINIKDEDWDDDSKAFSSNDDLTFEYIRSLLIHPFKADRYLKNPNNKLRKYLSKQASFDIVIDKDMYISFSNLDKKLKGRKNDIFIRICSIDDSKFDIDTIVLPLRMIDIKRYAVKKYEAIRQITEWVIGVKELIIKKVIRKFNLSNDNKELLDKVIQRTNEMYIWNHEFKELSNQYSKFILNKFNSTNEKVINEYFNEAFSIIRNNIYMLENYNYNDEENNFGEILNNLTSWKYLEKDDIYNVEKIFCYLNGERKGEMPNNDDCNSTNKEWGLWCAKLFYCSIGYRYVTMDVDDKSLSFDEIKLLVSVSLFKLNEDINCVENLNHKQTDK